MNVWPLTPDLLGPGDCLIKLNATGLCMSDVHFMLNDWALPKMSEVGTQCAGHEGAGVIVKVGPEVKNMKVGQRAGFKPIQDVCHTCEYCKSGKDQYCTKGVFTGLFCDGKMRDQSSVRAQDKEEKEAEIDI